MNTKEQEDLIFDNSVLRHKISSLEHALDQQTARVKELRDSLAKAYSAIRHVTAVRAAEQEHRAKHTTPIDNSIHKDRALDL